MQPQLQLENTFAGQVEQAPQNDVLAVPQWSIAKRVGFRFTFAYIVSFCFTFTPYCLQFAAPVFAKYDLFLHRVAIWYAKHIIHLSHDITVFSNGSGDTTYDWVLLLVYLNLAVIATIVWSILDGGRPNYIKLHMWFRTYMRLFLGGVLVLYGAVKAFPLQMPYPSYTRLLEPYGESSPMGILWTFIGASPAYSCFTGIVESTAGILLLFPRLTTVGSLLGTAAMGQVFVLNMCYDVPVKILSFHLLLLSVILLLPELRRLSDVMIFNRKVEPVKPVPLFTAKWPKRIAA